MLIASFDPWNRRCSDGHNVFVECFQALFKTQLSRRKEGSHERLFGANRATFKDSVKDSDKSFTVSPTASVISAPPTGTSSSSGSFRQSKTRMHSSLASLLGRKKEVKGSKPSGSKKRSAKRCQKSQESEAGDK